MMGASRVAELARGWATNVHTMRSAERADRRGDMSKSWKLDWVRINVEIDRFL